MGGAEVTVLLSTFNGSAHLPEQLVSLAAQCDVVWKLHTRDDGSADGSHNQISAWIHERPTEHHRQLASGPMGVVASYLELLASVDTPYFAFCDQDDVWYPHKLRWSLDALQQRGGPEDIAAVATDAHLVDGKMRRLHDSALRARGLRGRAQPSFGELLMLNAVTGATMVGTRALAMEMGRVAEHGHPEMHDWLAALVASSADGLFVGWFPTMAHRRHSSATTGLPRAGAAQVVAVARSGRRHDLVSRARRNADPLAIADRTIARPADRRALERLMTIDHPAGRGDLVKLFADGARVWPNRRAVSLVL